MTATLTPNLAVLVPLSKLRPHPANPRTITTTAFERLKHALEADPNHLWQRPLAARSDGTVYCGNMRLLALQKLGWTEAPVVYEDLPAKEEDLRRLRDNASYGEDDDQALAELLYHLQEQDADLSLSGFDDAAVSKLLDSVSGPELPLGGVGTPVFSNVQIIDSAVDYFRRSGFPYRTLPVHLCMQQLNDLAATNDAQLLNTTTGYHVADTYHPHRFHATAETMKSPVQAFEDDKLLRRALSLAVENGRTVGTDYFTTLNIVSGTQAASNFRPGFALLLYRRFATPDSVVLDTSTGYGGRLVGFMASGCARYIGIDPNVPTHDGNTRMAADLGFAERVELYNLPAEDVPHATVAGRCDFAFTSPPYFAKEHYSDDDTQSWKRYQTGESWREGFLVPMMLLQYVALKTGCFAVVNIADVKMRSTTYPLVEWAVAAGKAAGLTFVKEEKFALPGRDLGAGIEDLPDYEPLLIFQKTATLEPRKEG